MNDSLAWAGLVCGLKLIAYVIAVIVLGLLAGAFWLGSKF